MYIAKTDSWYMERLIFLIAGLVALTGATLTFYHSVYWLILVALVGVNLVIFSLTGFCIMANILSLFGVTSANKR